MLMKRIDSLQGLRAIAFLAIFISHASIGPLGGLGAWAVSIFLCLSGFTMMYSYYHRETQPKFSLSFMWSKIKKLYPLHIVTMLGALLYEMVVLNKELLQMGIEVILHTFLIQIWSPDPKYYSTLNSIS